MFPHMAPAVSRLTYPNNFESALRSARDIISMISSRRAVTKLILGYHNLGDEGCVLLFQFLSSPAGRRHCIANISLNSNSISDSGLLAISTYLKDNENLKELFLQNNIFKGAAPIVAAFADAVNNSHLELLSLTANLQLSDSFIESFLSVLDSPHLRELHISAISLSSRSVPHIVEYVSSRRCHLHTIKCNANSLGLRGVVSIIRAIERNSYNILTIELYSNQIGGTLSNGDGRSGDDYSEDLPPGGWEVSEALLKRTLARNAHLKRETEKQAFSLLRHARPLLLHSTLDSKSKVVPILAPCLDSCVRSAASECSLAPGTPGKKPGFPFKSLPIEIQLHILSFFAPSLSPAQRIRIYQYVSLPSTLPHLLPPLLTRMSRNNDSRRDDTLSVLDPSSLSFGVSGKVWGIGGRDLAWSQHWAAGGCLGSVVSYRERDRIEWLATVGCSAYELGDAYDPIPTDS